MCGGEIQEWTHALSGRVPSPAYVQQRLAAHIPPRADAADLPTVADLAGNAFVKLTPEIRAKATELGGSPLLIYQVCPQFLRIRRIMQDSEAVYWSGRGSDADLATYLIALLRASGTPARYALVSAQIHGCDLMQQRWSRSAIRSIA